MPRKIGQHLPPYQFPVQDLGEDSSKELVVRYPSPIKALKFFLCKFIFSKEKLTPEDAVILFTLFEKVIYHVETGRWQIDSEMKYILFLLRAEFQQLDQLTTLSGSARQEYLQEKYSGTVIFRSKKFSERVYWTLKGHMQQLVIAYSKYWTKRRSPPKAYIGKGYGDKGTARKPELDGSPSWQEVSMDQMFQENNRQRDRAVDSTNYWKNYLVHPVQLSVSQWKLARRLRSAHEGSEGH